VNLCNHLLADRLHGFWSWHDMQFCDVGAPARCNYSSAPKTKTRDSRAFKFNRTAVMVGYAACLCMAPLADALPRMALT